MLSLSLSAFKTFYLSDLLSFSLLLSLTLFLSTYFHFNFYLFIALSLSLSLLNLLLFWLSLSILFLLSITKILFVLPPTNLFFVFLNCFSLSLFLFLSRFQSHLNTLHLKPNFSFQNPSSYQ